MAVIETKFSVGDVVYHANTTTETRQHPCPDCLGSKAWRAVSPAGGEFSVPCPRCGGGYQSNRALNLKYTHHVPAPRRLTIGSVRVNTADNDYDGGNSYMCLETGVGSGSVYREADLFATEEDARRAAQAKADVQNADAEGWVAKQYAETVKFSDYELRDAAIASAEDRERNSRVRISILLDDLEDALSLDEVKTTIERWRNACAPHGSLPVRAPGEGVAE